MQQKNKRSGSFEPEKLQNNFMHKSFVSCEPCRKFSSAFESLQHFSFFFNSKFVFLFDVAQFFVCVAVRKEKSKRKSRTGQKMTSFSCSEEV